MSPAQAALSQMLMWFTLYSFAVWAGASTWGYLKRRAVR